MTLQVGWARTAAGGPHTRAPPAGYRRVWRVTCGPPKWPSTCMFVRSAWSADPGLAPSQAEDAVPGHECDRSKRRGVESDVRLLGIRLREDRGLEMRGPVLVAREQRKRFRFEHGNLNVVACEGAKGGEPDTRRCLKPNGRLGLAIARGPGRDSPPLSAPPTTTAPKSGPTWPPTPWW